MFEAGKFGVDLSNKEMQQVSIMGKSGQVYGTAKFEVSVEVMKSRKERLDEVEGEGYKENESA